MNNIPYYIRKMRTGYRMGHGEVEDGLVTALSDPITRDHMGITAENVAERYHVSREDQDKYALLSQQRAAKARDISATIQLLKNSKNSVLHSKKMEQ